MAHSSIRFGIGRFTTEEEVDFVIGKIVAIVEREWLLLDPREVLLIRCLGRLGRRSARSLAALGDGPGGNRHQDDRLVRFACLPVHTELTRLLLTSPTGPSTERSAQRYRYSAVSGIAALSVVA